MKKKGKKMKFLVTGVNGQLGYDIVKELEKRGHEAVGTDRSTMDITNQAQVEEVVKREKIDGIFHCAAYTAAQ